MQTTVSLEDHIHSMATLSPYQWNKDQKQAVIDVISQLNLGTLRVASPTPAGWQHHTWIQKAIGLYFALATVTEKTTPWPHRDLLPSKYEHADDFHNSHIRLVPPAYVRHGAYVAAKTVLMPCFVNIGAYIDTGCMIDTWATVGSCAQIGKQVHVSGGAGIGGVLEPAQATPTIIEDHCFIGARSEIAEGVHVKQGAVIASGVFLTQSTKIYDRTTKETHTGTVPANAVVVPGSLPAADGSHSVQAAIIVKYADDSTRGKTALNEWLRTMQ